MARDPADDALMDGACNRPGFREHPEALTTLSISAKRATRRADMAKTPSYWEEGGSSWNRATSLSF
jgi:hypothetical protein